MKNIIVVVVAVLIAVSTSWWLSKQQVSKIGYIKSGMIISDYKAMKAANEQFDKEIAQVQSNIDTLKNRYLKLKNEESSVSGKAKVDWAYQLGVTKNEYEKYEQQAAEQMEARKQQLTGKILQEVNAFIQQYGKENNYKLILGTTNDGSILYGNEADDLTTIILEQLNK